MLRALTEWWERRRILRELGSARPAAQSNFATYFSEQIEVARTANQGGAHDQANLILSRMWRDYPDLAMTSETALKLLTELGRFEEAEAAVKAGPRRFKRFRGLYAEVDALIAYRRGGTDEALKRLEALRRDWPRIATGYTIGATILSDMGRDNDAERVLDQGIGKIPNDLDMVVAYARFAVRRGDWAAAHDRWKMVETRFNYWLGPLGMAEALRHLGRLEEAEAVITTALAENQSISWLYGEAAAIAMAKDDPTAAARIWADARLYSPDFNQAYTSGADLALRAGNPEEADRILSLGVPRLRYDEGIHLAYARIAHDRGDWAEAAARWALTLSRFPACGEARIKQTEAAAHLERGTGP